MIDKRLDASPLVYAVYAGIILLIYSPAFMSSFALTDDWSMFYSGLNAQWEIMSGRPIFGILARPFFIYANSIADLRFGRLFAAGCTAFYCCLLRLFLQERCSLKSKAAIFFLPLLQGLLPPFIVYVSWVTCFLFPLSAFLAAASYYLLAKARHEGTTKRSLYTGASVLCIVIAFNIHQAAAMCFLVPLVSEICCGKERVGIRLLIRPAMVLAFGMFTTFFVVKGLCPYILHWDITAARPGAAFVSDYLGKIKWFLAEVFPHAICTWGVYSHRGFWVFKLLSFCLFVCGLLFIYRKRGIAALALTCLIIPFSFLPNLITRESYIAYRNMAAISSCCSIVILMGCCMILRALVFYARARNVGRALFVILCIAFLCAAVFAQRYIIKGFILPSKLEYYTLYDKLNRLPKDRPIQVAFWKSRYGTIYERSGDEFGGLHGVLVSWGAPNEIRYIIEKNSFSNMSLYNPPYFGEHQTPPQNVPNLYVIDIKDIIFSAGNLR